MILERIRLRGFGKFADERTVPAEGVFDPHLHVIAGENEAGKTTLFMALHHALFTPYTSTAREVRAIQPWGSALTPWVQIDFRFGDRRFRLTKAFLYEPFARLAEWRDGHYEPLADGDRADEMVRQMLWADRPGRGAAQEQHRGIARLLWVPQGEAALPALDGTLRERVEAALGALTLTPEESALRRRLAATYAEWWTERGQPRSKVFDPLEREVAHLEEELRRIDDELAGYAEASVRLEGILRRQDDLRQRKAELEQALKALEADARRIERLKADYEKAKAQLAAEEERFRRCDERRDTLRRARAAEAEKRRQLDEHREIIEGLERKRERAERELAEAEEAVAAAAKALQEAEDEFRDARRLHEARRWMSRSAEERQRLARVTELQREADALRQTLHARPAPTPEVLEQARRIEAELHRVEGALASAGLQIALNAEAPLHFTYTADGGREVEVRLDAAQEAVLRASRSASLYLPGVGTLRIRSGAVELAALEQQRDRLRNDMQRLLRTYGVAAPRDLILLHEAYQRDKAQLDRLHDQIQSELRPHADRAALQAALEEAEREIDALAARLGLSREELAGQPLPNLAAFDERLAGLRRGADEARRRREEARERLAEIVDTWHGAQRQRVQLETELAGVRAQAEAVLREAGSEADVEFQYHEARRLWEAARHRANDLAAQLPKGADDPIEQSVRLQSELAAVEEQLEKLRQREADDRSYLRQVAERGSYEQKAALEERLALAKRRREQAWREAKAIKLLHRLAEARQEQVTRSLTEPVSRRVSGYFERVTGRVGRRVQIDAGLQPSAVDERVMQDIPTEMLSAGTREQLIHLTRLALARYLVQREGRMLFVLDDTLVYTDAVRHRRFLELLEEASADLQIIVLTCHEERFRGLRGARIEHLS